MSRCGHAADIVLLSGFVAALISVVPGYDAAGAAGGVRVTQLIVREQLIIRVPTRPAPRSVWKEKRMGRCIALSDLAASAVVPPDSVDFILRGGRRVRAKLDDSCPALDYYSGFYVLPTADGQMCADRDSIHDRSGNECEVTRFRKLTPRAAATP